MHLSCSRKIGITPINHNLHDQISRAGAASATWPEVRVDYRRGCARTQRTLHCMCSYELSKLELGPQGQQGVLRDHGKVGRPLRLVQCLPFDRLRRLGAADFLDAVFMAATALESSLIVQVLASCSDASFTNRSRGSGGHYFTACASLCLTTSLTCHSHGFGLRRRHLSMGPAFRLSKTTPRRWLP